MTAETDIAAVTGRGPNEAAKTRDALTGVLTVAHTNPIDIPPAVPDPFDDEFDDDTITGWTAVHAGTAPVWSESDFGLQLETAAEANHNWKAQLKAIPGGDFEVTLKVGVSHGESINFTRAGGLAITSGTANTNPVLLIARAWNQAGTARWDAGVTQLTNFTTFSATRGAVLLSQVLPRVSIYFRASKATTTWTFQASTDGITWSTGYTVTEASLGWTPTHIGPIGCALNATNPMSCRFEWFRKTA